MPTSETKNCQNCKQNFTIEPADFDFYKRIDVPPPTFCPDCRLQRRMSFRNERSLYKDECDLCNKQMISMYSPDKPFKVYCKECWYSDKWDPLQHGREYDWNKPFFVQFNELAKEVPRIATMKIRNNINCDYANFIADAKNVYLSQSVTYNSENIYYSRSIDKSKDIFDCFSVKESEQCYENVDGARNYRSKFLLRSRDCINSEFLFDCVNCQNCVMSSNLRNRQFVIRNTQYDKESYKKEIAKLNSGKYSEFKRLREEFTILVGISLHKFASILKSVNSVGDNIDTSKNAIACFDISGGENVKFITRVIGMKDSFDIFGAGQGELIYEGLAAGFGSYGSKFFCFGDAYADSEYSEWCTNIANLFGCTGIRKKQYCILNKQYTKEEYEKLVPKIVEHMNSMPYTDKKGRIYKYREFFPVEFSPFAYNETIAQEYFPLTKEQTVERGYAWREPDPPPHKPTITAENLPDDIRDAADSIVSEIISCDECGRAYRILKAELEFLKQHGIALPRACPECRHKRRFNLRNPLKLWHRKCTCLADSASIATSAEETVSTKAGVRQNTSKHFHGESPCPNTFETSYAPEKREIIYCEQCYNAEIV